ncbi:MAG: hypothetical protein QXL17_06280 [Candidatus Thermoplasmatota archaeon]
MDEEIKKLFEDHEQRIAKLEMLIHTKPDIIKKKISIKEFILSKKPKDDIQKTLVIGNYYEKYLNVNCFNIKDIKAGFIDAKEPLPSNINQMVNENIKKGHMMPAKEKKDKLKAWTLTSSGERFVDNDLKESDTK